MVLQLYDAYISCMNSGMSYLTTFSTIKQPFKTQILPHRIATPNLQLSSDLAGYQEAVSNSGLGRTVVLFPQDHSDLKIQHEEERRFNTWLQYH